MLVVPAGRVHCCWRWRVRIASREGFLDASSEANLVVMEVVSLNCRRDGVLCDSCRHDELLAVFAYVCGEMMNRRNLSKLRQLEQEMVEMPFENWRCLSQKFETKRQGTASICRPSTRPSPRTRATRSTLNLRIRLRRKCGENQ